MTSWTEFRRDLDKEDIPAEKSLISEEEENKDGVWERREEDVFDEWSSSEDEDAVIPKKCLTCICWFKHT